MLVWPPKDPNEVLDYRLSWSLSSAETITSSVFTIVAGSVAIQSQSYTNTNTTITPPATVAIPTVSTVWLTGGTAGEACTILNRIVTSSGRTYDQSVRLRIRDK